MPTQDDLNQEEVEKEIVEPTNFEDEPKEDETPIPTNTEEPEALTYNPDDDDATIDEL